MFCARSWDAGAAAVDFPAPLDHSLALDSIGVEAPKGSLIPGVTELDATSTRWTFRPNGPWTAGEPRLAAQGEVEDLAGISLYRPFETPAGDAARPAAHPPIYRRMFSVK